jgi:small subunit ribosomal protein S3
LGHKVNPTGFRLGIIRDWQSKWYTDTHYAEFAREDVKLRTAIRDKYREAAISLVEIDRQAKDVTIALHTARPGIVIGRGGQRVDEMRLYLEGLIGKRVRLNIQEVRQPELDAYLVARSIAEQIERRVAYRRAMKQAMLRTIQSGAKGIKISCAGRLGNAEIARRQTSHEGQVPLHTLRADIDYGFTEAHTTLGRIGVKVWIYKGQVLPELKVAPPAAKSVEAAEEGKAVGAAAEGAVAPVAAALAKLVGVVSEADVAEKLAAEEAGAPVAKKAAKPKAKKAEAEEPVAEVKKAAKPKVKKAEVPAAEAKKPAKAEAEAPAAEVKKAAKPKVKKAEAPAAEAKKPAKAEAEAEAPAKPKAKKKTATRKEDKDAAA